ncbi:CocE/NonD family hydrolase [Lentzea flava]|uniref:X-Pro dipeptidyl-peptidase n=1 Tax=Lentzea flava TaxID=103732 RepID=A0ABQ2UBX7_9PSEU|nr:CocE/NonD family hydrolase [Lentzea flava]MCP2197142.1 X-Pro dipeptidyl-peptidase [Lentzea flava]GGU13059.1 X-Pro dipeptidyl-peptidase [Lentzea flava]
MRRVILVAAALLTAATITTPVSHAAAAAITETVYVESTTDSDADGQPDRIAADVMRPDTAGKVPVVMEASPYYGLGAEMAATVPRGFKRWYDEYFVPRGYAVVEVEMQGTSRSTGCPTTGGPEDTASVRAVVDWLNGRAKAFYADGRPAVAGWSTGNVGMLGVSYNGTLPNAAAAAGIPGVKTIVPIAAISSWYEYSRDQGIGYRGAHAKDYPTYLANYVISAAQKAKCKPVLDRLAREDGDESYDYTAFWKARDYRQTVQNVSASVFVVHGQADWNVKPSQFGRWWQNLADRGVPRKIWLHRGGHLDPISFRQAEWQRVMGLWMDYWLKGVDNGIMREPMADIQRPDGSWEQHTAWPQPGTKDATLYFGPAAGGFAGSLTTTPGSGTQRLGDNANLSESAMMANPELTDSRRLVYVTAPLKEAARLSGEVRVTARVASNRPSTPLTALLVDYGPSTQPVLTDRSPLQLSTETCTRSDLRNRTGCARPPDVSVQAVTATLLTRGAIDAKNRESLESAVPLPTNATADVSWRLHARDAVIPAGHRIGIVVVTNHGGYISQDTGANGIGIDVSLGVSKVVLPVVGGAVIT